jgi:hypothetical protein
MRAGPDPGAEVTKADGTHGAVRGVARAAISALPLPMRRAVLHASGRYAPWEDGFDFTPPMPGPGEVTGPPEFVGIGAQKAGTTWWYELVAAHPDVAHRPDLHKERHFFDRFATRSFGPDDGAQYRGWFPRPSGKIAGEWTPDYLSQSWVPPLLAEAAPDARLLVLLRDPVERFRSGLTHHRTHRGALTADAAADAVQRGFYDQWLAHWTRYFDRERILVLQYERCVREPLGELDRTFRFLGLAPYVPVDAEQPVNESTARQELPDDARRRLRELYAPDVASLAANWPGLDLALWPDFAGAVHA